MAGYENGSTTRKQILDACVVLFYEKGYFATGYDDICAKAHVSRNTVHYHFKTKHAILDAVLWYFILNNRNLAAKYCPAENCHFLIATYCLWYQAKADPHMRRFLCECFQNEQVYIGRPDIPDIHVMMYTYLWGDFKKLIQIPEYSFVSGHSYLSTFMRMFCAEPGKYDLWEMFMHCVTSCLYIWGIPQIQMDHMLTDIKQYIALIPETDFSVRLPSFIE